MTLRFRLPQKLLWCLLSVLMGVWLTGCANGLRRPEVVRLPRPADVAQRLEDRRRAVRSFKMQGEIEVQNGQGQLNGDHFITGAYPDRLRAEIMGPFGRPALTLVSDGVWLTVVDYQAGAAYRGIASRQSVARFLGLPLSMAEIYAIITGNIPFDPNLKAQVAASPLPGRGVLSILAAGGSLGLDITFNLSGFTVTGAWLRRWPGRVEMTCSFEDLVDLGFSSYPKGIKIKDADGRSMTLENDELVINQQPPAGAFELTLPAGMPLRPLPVR